MSAVTSPIGTEVLDGASCPPDLVRATLSDIARANTLFGGRAAVWFGVRQLLDRAGRRLTVLDIGAGGGDIAGFVSRQAKKLGTTLVPLALDRHPAAAALCRQRGFSSVVADARALPLAPGSVDIVIASQVLHHFSRDGAIELLRAFAPVARVGLVVADLRRASAAAMGIWLAGLALGFHPVTRRDGVTSVRRGFSAPELTELMFAAGLPATVHRRPGYRLVAATEHTTRTVDRIGVRAPIERVFAVASDVERWPDFLPHYRWVRILERNRAGCRVDMAAWRPFGVVRYPTRWVSEMQVDRAGHRVNYRHVEGITRGMDVEWSMHHRGAEVEVTIVHEWNGPSWPWIGGLAASLVIGPVFIHGIASRTLAGVKRRAEAA